MTAIVASLAFFVAGYFLGSSRRGGKGREGGVESREAEFGHLRERLEGASSGARPNGGHPADG